MDESSSCQQNLFRNCRNGQEIRDLLKNKIERCIQKYMSLEETMRYLQHHHLIPHRLTKLIWEHLQRMSPNFFKNYYLRCNLTRQLKEFNELVAKQAARMLEQGLIGVYDPPPAIKTFLSQHPEGINLMKNLADRLAYTSNESLKNLALPSANDPTAHAANASLSNLALPSTNGPTVTQSQIHNDHQTHLHLQPSTSTGLAYYYSGVPTVAPAATDWWSTLYNSADDNLGAISPTTATDQQWTSYDPAYCSQAPTTTPAATVQMFSTTATNHKRTSYRPAYNDLGASTVAPIATHQQSTIYDPAYHNLLTPTHVPADKGQRSSSEDLSYVEAQLPEFPGQAATMAEDPSTSQSGGNTGHNSLSILDLDAQLYQVPDLSLPKSQLKPKFTVEAQQTLQNGSRNGPQCGGGSSWMQNGVGSSWMQNGVGSDWMQNGVGSNTMTQFGGESNIPQFGGGSNWTQCAGGNNWTHCGGGSMQNEQHSCHNFDRNQTMRPNTSVNQQQAQGVRRSLPEYKDAVTNPSGDEELTRTQNQQGSQRKEKCRCLFKN